MLVVSRHGERTLLDAATGQTPATRWTLRLFTNDHVPTVTDTEADYTEATGAGYAGLPLTASRWTPTPADGAAGSPTSTSYPPQTFTFTGALADGATVYGYYVTRADGQLVYGERLTRPFAPLNNGDSVVVPPALTLAGKES